MVQRQLDEETARTELQLSVLNENLGTVRTDLVAAQTQLTELTKLSDDLKGEKLGWWDFIHKELLHLKFILFLQKPNSCFFYR